MRITSLVLGVAKSFATQPFCVAQPIEFYVFNDNLEMGIFCEKRTFRSELVKIQSL